MKYFYMICFDVSDKKRLRQTAIQLQNFGQRNQNSVFECHLTDKNLNTLKNRLAKIIDPNTDHIRYYRLCNKDIKKVRIDGRGRITPDNDYHLA